jgi:nitroreductase
MLVDKQRPVPHEVIRDLCELAQWAPNHKRTWPWRFAIADGEARARLGEVIAEAMEGHGDPPEKVEKARTKYLRTPATLVVGSAPGDSPLRTAENRDAAAAGIQIILPGRDRPGPGQLLGVLPKGSQRCRRRVVRVRARYSYHRPDLLGMGVVDRGVPRPSRPRRARDLRRLTGTSTKVQ